MMQIFLLFFHNSFFFVYRHYDLEDSCSNGTKTRHVNLAVAIRGMIDCNEWQTQNVMNTQIWGK